MSILTPTIPERAGLLPDAIRSGQAQQGVRVEHLWLEDTWHRGCSATINELSEYADGDWIVPLADDDILLPWFCRAHVDADEGGVVYGPPYVINEHPDGFYGDPPNIPATALIPTSLWRGVGGYEDVPEMEDRKMWEAFERNAVRFTRLGVFTWIYRFHGANKSRGWRPG